MALLIDVDAPLPGTVMTDDEAEALYCRAAMPKQAPPPATTSAGLTPEQLAALQTVHADDWWLDRLMPVCVTACALMGAAARLGWI